MNNFICEIAFDQLLIFTDLAQICVVVLKNYFFCIEAIVCLRKIGCPGVQFKIGQRKGTSYHKAKS